MSWGMIRNPYYETFKKFHSMFVLFCKGLCGTYQDIRAATLFMVALFLYCNWRLTSWYGYLKLPRTIEVTKIPL
jgi:hypothetical protein